MKRIGTLLPLGEKGGTRECISSPRSSEGKLLEMQRGPGGRKRKAHEGIQISTSCGAHSRSVPTYPRLAIGFRQGIFRFNCSSKSVRHTVRTRVLPLLRGVDQVPLDKSNASYRMAKEKRISQVGAAICAPGCTRSLVEQLEEFGKRARAFTVRR